MKKGEIREGLITSYYFPNKGSLIDDDIKITVKNALKGQRVSYQVQKKRHGNAVGRLLDVLERSTEETCEPFCSDFGSCGSCLYQCYPYEKQLEVKKELVLKLIDEVCSDYSFDGAAANPSPYAYRNKMEYTFGDEYKGGPLVCGLHKRGSFHDLIDASCCKLVNDDFGKILSCVRDYCTEKELPFYHRMSHEGFLRHLLIRRATVTGEILVDIVTTGDCLEVCRSYGSDNQNRADNNNSVFCELCDRLLLLPLEGKIVGILNTINNSIADTIKDEGTILLYGQDYFYEELLGLKFKITPFSFFQTNSKGAEVLYETARKYISTGLSGENRNKVVYDLYCGTGTISQMMAPHSKKVVGVEIVEEAVEAARENAKLNNIDNCEFIAGDVLKVLDSIESKPDIIILDPPRDGVHPKALEKIIAFGVDEIVYISCKPTSLARDLKVFIECGYEIKNVSVVDMFSWTAHIETVCLFKRKGGNNE